MKHFLGLMACCAVLSGCVTPKAIRMTSLPPVASPNVIDATPKDDYPSLGTGELNIYSCRYGIHHYSRLEFDPAKRDTFARLLLDRRPQLATLPVRLERLDLYRNLRLRGLSSAGSHIGGGLGAAIGNSADRTSLASSGMPGFSIERDPKASGHDVNQVGCDNQGEGEYDASTVAPGHDVMVLWLAFSVGTRRYSWRSQYAFQFDDSGGFAKAAETVLALTVEHAALAIELP